MNKLVKKPSELTRKASSASSDGNKNENLTEISTKKFVKQTTYLFPVYNFILHQIFFQWRTRCFFIPVL